MFSGRKKDSSVWQWFRYDECDDKSVCLATTKDGKDCGKVSWEESNQPEGK
jgi:hypothetical protein